MIWPGNQATKAVLSRPLSEVAVIPLDQLRSMGQEADDLDALLADDPAWHLRMWLVDPQEYQHAIQCLAAFHEHGLNHSRQQTPCDPADGCASR